MSPSPGETSLLKNLGLPALPLSQDEKMRQLMASRNLWKLYRRKCDATAEDMLSAYPEDSEFTVYKNAVWWGDTWDAMKFGRDVDFNRPFFEQYRELQLAVPREGTSVFECENCAYNSHVRFSKNCYMNSLAVHSEDIHYCHWMVSVESSLDCCFHISGKSSLCYDCLDFSNCYNCVGLQESYNCNECYFSYQLRGCKNCLFCSNLSNKEYHIANKPCTKEEFEKQKAAFLNGSSAAYQKGCAGFADVRAKAVHRAAYLLNCENVTGDHIFNARNCSHCFDGDASEDCTDTISLSDSKDIHSCYSAGWPRCEQLYQCVASRGCTGMAFCNYMWFCNDMLYSDSCQSCKHGIGCIGLRHKDYCIFNKQYTKEEYEKLRAKLITHMQKTPLRSLSGSFAGQAGEWGAFFPFALLPFAYNETAAQEYFPLNKKEATAMGFKWREIPDITPEAKNILEAKDLPDAIDDVSDDILHSAIRCAATGKLFKIIKQELDFYRRMRLPLPRLHPEERHRRRMALRNPYALWKRPCMQCKKEMQTSYSPERPEKVVCEECYLKEVY